MPPPLKLFQLGCLLAALLVLSSAAFAQTTVELDVVTASDEFVLLSKSVDESPSHEIIALNARTGAFLWRDRVSGVISAGAGDSFVYLVANKELQKRTLASGKVEWRSRLNKIPQQGVTNSFGFEDMKEWALHLVGKGTRSKPDHFICKILPSGGKVLIFRSAIDASDQPCFEDWVILDENSGRMVDGGKGDFAGQAGRTTLIAGEDGFSIFRDGLKRSLTNSPVKGEFSVRARSDRDPWTLADRCIFEVNEFEAVYRHSLVFFDGREDRFTSFPIPDTRPNFFAGWVLMASNVVRYAVMAGNTGLESVPTNNTPWFELYDFDGRLIASAEKDIGSTNHLLMAYRFRMGSCIHFENENTNYQLDVPSLNFQALNNPAESGRGEKTKDGAISVRWWDSSYTHGNTIYQIDGNIYVGDIDGNQLAHKITVTALDSDTQKPLWRHTEPVLIHKSPETVSFSK